MGIPLGYVWGFGFGGEGREGQIFIFYFKLRELYDAYKSKQKINMLNSCEFIILFLSL